MPEMAVPNVHPLAVPPIIRPIHAAIIDNRSVIRRPIGVVAIWITTVAVRVVSRVSVDWKSETDAD